MRTTLDIDDTLLARAQSRFPKGTPKTVIVEEGLRRLTEDVHADAGADTRGGPKDPVLRRLIAEGRAVAPTWFDPLPAPPDNDADIPLATLLRDLALDREDR
jgi:hypothetical protein